MSTHRLQVMVPAPVSAPRGALWATRTLSAVARFGRAAWLALQRAGQLRAARELRLIAQRYQLSDPALAEQIRAASHFKSIE